MAREVVEEVEALGVLAVEVVVEAVGMVEKMVEKMVEATGTEEMMGATVGAMVVTRGGRALKELRIQKTRGLFPMDKPKMSNKLS